MARRNRSAEDKPANQYANYMTFENSLQLRSNVNIVVITAEIQDITHPKFGENYVGEHMVWTQ